MEYREFEKLGISPSLLGFGCMRFPTNEDGKIDYEKSEEMIDYAIKHGVTYIDTARPYHFGESEVFLGKTLKKYPRDSYYLATKMSFWKLKTLEDAIEFFNAQLKDLQTDYFDFYLLHCLDKETWEKAKSTGMLDFLISKKEEGIIKYLGFSFHDEYEVFEEIATYREWDFCQIQYNYVDRDIQAGDKGYDLTVKLGIPLVIMEPIKGGNLSVLPDEVSKPFKEYAPDKTISSWALRWVASHPNVKVILSGMSTLDHVIDNVNTFSTLSTLNEEENKIVEEVADSIKKRIKVGCTGCEYCMPCPFGVNIPVNFRIWNDYAMYNNIDKFKARFDTLKEGVASNCKECGKCETLCPQNISIREMLKAADADFKGIL